MGSEHPFFSIIIPTRGRPRQLGTCLEALSRLDYPRNRFEVIVVDDGSEMPPGEVVASFRNQINARLLTQTHAGPAAARNTGAAQARGSFLAFTDDDCKPAPDWLTALAARITRSPDCAIGGQTFNALPDNPYSTAHQLISDIVYAYYNAHSHQARFFATNNLAVPTDRFRAIGGFDAGSFPLASEDRDFCDRWLHCGYRMVYAPEVRVYHTHVLTFSSFLRHHFRHGCGAFRFQHIRIRSKTGPVKLDLGFYLHLLKYPLSQGWRRRTILLEWLVILARVVYVAGYYWERLHREA
jgi:GT2 family glycosyltransferase